MDLVRLLKSYQEDPNSKIFAPLAEIYRKDRNLTEALSIAQEGVLRHPHYPGGKLVLAKIYFDLKQYSKVIEILEPLLDQVPENSAVVRLLGDTAILLEKTKLAFKCYKLASFLNPSDEVIYKLVRELEVQMIRESDIELKDIEIRLQAALLLQKELKV